MEWALEVLKMVELSLAATIRWYYLGMLETSMAARVQTIEEAKQLLKGMGVFGITQRFEN